MKNDKRIHFTEFIKDFSATFKAKNTLLINGSSQSDLRIRPSEIKYSDMGRIRDTGSFHINSYSVQGWLYWDILNFKKNISVIDYNISKLSNTDFIFADLPINMGPKEKYHFDKSKNVFKSWNILISLLENLSADGTLLVILPLSIMHSRSSPDLLMDLKKHGYHCNIILKTPERIHPHNGLNTCVLGFQKKITKTQFIAQIEADYDNETNNYKKIISNYNLKQNENYINGFWGKRGEFISFSHYAFQNRLKKIGKYYKGSKDYKLSEIILKDGVRTISRGSFKDKRDALYIKSIGKIFVSFEYEKIEKHHNYIQLIINTKIVSVKFLSLFYTSVIGVEILKSLKRGNTIQRIHKLDLISSMVKIPPLKEQKSFIDAHEKLSKLEESIQSLKNELSLNPNTKNEILLKWEELHKPFVKLTDIDKIRNLISIGETKKIEFKETLSLNTHTQNKDPEIEKTALKNIAAFLNTDGGTLLIGVADNGEIKGVENDVFTNKDKYLLHFMNLIKDKIDESIFPLIEYSLVDIDDKLVLIVECDISKQPVYLKIKNEEEFYIKTNPAALQLKASSLYNYLKKREMKFSISK